MDQQQVFLRSMKLFKQTEKCTLTLKIQYLRFSVQKVQKPIKMF